MKLYIYRYEMVWNGDYVRDLARRCHWFLCPYDILTGADIALFENTIADEKHPERRYIVCSLDEVQEKMVRVKSKEHMGESEKAKRYCIVDFTTISEGKYSAASPEEAIERWNCRAQLTAKLMLKKFPRRFFLLEYANMFKNALLWGLVFFIVLLNNDVYHFAQEHSFFVLFVFILLCSNIKNVFLKSYGEEIPRHILERWADRRFEGDFYEQAMAEWASIREWHESSVPIYLLWRRGKMRPAEEESRVVAAPAAIESREPSEPDPPEEDRSHEIYCEEIKTLLAAQMRDIDDYNTKIRDKAVKKDIEAIAAILGEIQEIIGIDAGTEQILAARPVVTYWNEKVLSLLKSYISLLKNSSDEAGEARRNIESVLQEVQHVYRKELGRITEKNTTLLNASIAVMREEIDQALRKRV